MCTGVHKRVLSLSTDLDQKVNNKTMETQLECRVKQSTLESISSDISAILFRMNALEREVRSSQCLQEELKESRREVMSLKEENKRLQERYGHLQESVYALLEKNVQPLDYSSILILQQALSGASKPPSKHSTPVKVLPSKGANLEPRRKKTKMSESGVSSLLSLTPDPSTSLESSLSLISTLENPSVANDVMYLDNVTLNPDKVSEQLDWADNKTEDGDSASQLSFNLGIDRAIEDTSPDFIDELLGKSSSLALRPITASDSLQNLKHLQPLAMESSTRHITDAEFSAINKRCFKGARGDSRFVRDAAELLWDRQTLACRSVTGSACVSKSKAHPYPECTPYKKKIIEDRLMNRLEIEGVVKDSKEWKDRIKSIRRNLNGKIKSVRGSILSHTGNGNEDLTT